MPSEDDETRAKRPRLDDESESPPGTPVNTTTTSNEEYAWHRAEQREASIARLSFGVQKALSDLFARMPRCEELEPCCFDSLGDFDEATGREIVAKFGSRDLSGVRSVTAYFCGLLKRYRGPPLRGVVSVEYEEIQQQKRGLQHVAHTAQGLAEQASSIASLAPSVRDAIEDVFRLDGVRRVEMEPCCFESLRDFAEPVALRIVRDFRNADMRTLRDKTAFFCSILKRYRAQAAAHGKIFGGVPPQQRLALRQQQQQPAFGVGPPPPPPPQGQQTQQQPGQGQQQLQGQQQQRPGGGVAPLGTGGGVVGVVNGVVNPQQATPADRRRAQRPSGTTPPPFVTPTPPVPQRYPQMNDVISPTPNSHFDVQTHFDQASPWTQRQNQRYVYEDHPYALPVWPYTYHPGIVPAPPAYYGGQGYMA